MDLNRATIIGNLTRDPELKSLPSGKSVATFSIATNRVWTDANGQKQKSAEFHNIVMWGKLAEIASQYLRKGRKAYVEGRMQTRDWTGQDGVKRYRTEVVADNMIMLDGNKGELPPLSNTSSGNTTQSSEPAVEVMEEEIKVEDIPF